MTYYNILFGLLFIGAFREVIHSLGTANIWSALLILAIVVNDMINVTDQFEQKGHGAMYNVWMKLIDLVCFMSLALALICLDPNESFMKMDVVMKIPGHDRPWLPWALLTLYWALAVIWNVLSKEYRIRGNPDPKDRSVQIWSILFLVPFLLNTVLVYANGPGPLTFKYFTLVTLAALIAYMTYFKPAWWKTGKETKSGHPTCAFKPTPSLSFTCEARKLESRFNTIEAMIAPSDDRANPK